MNTTTKSKNLKILYGKNDEGNDLQKIEKYYKVASFKKNICVYACKSVKHESIAYNYLYEYLFKAVLVLTVFP